MAKPRHRRAGADGLNKASQALGTAQIRAVLGVLTVINFLNYIDRQVLSAVLEDVRLELALTDLESGYLGSVFMIVYTLCAPFAGYVGDRGTRKVVVAVGVALWSLATIGSGLAQDYSSLMLMRALIGVGEAGYATVAPAMIADLVGPSRRGRTLAYFYLAIPMGSALGYLLGGWVGQHFGWRAAFFVAGGPGLIFAIAAALLPEPRRGAMDDDAALTGTLPALKSVRHLFRSPAWRINVVGTTLMTFSMGGLAYWMPSFLVRTQDLGLGTANTAFGGITVVAGLLGTLVGGHWGDRAFARGQGGYFRVSGWGLLLGAPFAMLAPFVPEVTWMFAAVFAAELLLFLNTGPLNAALVACVPPALRASAFALNVFFIHALGDAVSPTIMGWISERHGLAVAVSFTGLPLLVGGLVLFVGARRVDRWSAGLRTMDGDPPARS